MTYHFVDFELRIQFMKRALQQAMISILYDMNATRLAVKGYDPGRYEIFLLYVKAYGIKEVRFS